MIQQRSLQVLNLPQEQKRIDSNYYVEGYATTWERYLLWEDDDGPIYEQFSRDAFVGCEMSDVIFQYDHTGKVFARQSNKSLIVETNENGLFICADLSKSRSAQEMYEEIGSGLITKMSWTFAYGDYHYDEATRTFVHTKIKRIYDVSAVSIPANDTTSIYARSFCDENMKSLKQELQKEQQRKKLILNLKLEGF